MSTKTSSSSDNETDFHGAFTVAAAAKDNTIGNTPVIKTSKTPTRDTKSTDNKKKEVTSEAAVSDTSLVVVSALKKIASEDPTQATIGSLVKDDASAHGFDSGLKSAEAANGPNTGAASDRIVAAGTVSAADASFVGSELSVSASASAHSIGDAASLAASKAEIQKTAHDEDGQNTSASADPSEPIAGAGAIDLAGMTAQQAAALTQSIVAPSLLSNLSSGTLLQAVPQSAIGKTTSASTAAETMKGTASRQTDSAIKSKLASSDARGKHSDDDIDDTQTESIRSMASNAFAAKVSEATETLIHNASESKGGLDAAGIQQMTQASPLAGSSHASDTALNASPSADQTTRPAQVPAENQAMQGVSSAQLVQSMHSSEMKLGMQSAEFGNISISTSLNHQALSAQISIDHSELGRALAVHLPAIEEKLGSAYGVQAKVELRDTNNPSSASNESGYSNSGQQSREQRQSQTDTAAISQGAIYQRVASLATSTTTSAVVGTSRLDIRI